MVVAAHAGVDELDVDVVADAGQIAVVPDLKGEGRGLAAALVHGALVVAAAGVGVDAVGLAVGDVDVAAVGLPAGHAGGEVLVRVGDAGVVLFAVLVLGRVGIGIAAQPEVFDERVALLVVAQVLEGLRLLVGDDPADVLVEPLLVDAVQLAAEGLLLGALFLVGELALERVGLFDVGRLGRLGAVDIRQGAVASCAGKALTPIIVKNKKAVT